MDRLLKNATAPAYGCEIKFYHIRLNGLTFEGFRESTRQLGFDKYVMLTRQNFLKSLVSSVRMGTRGASHVQSGKAVKKWQVHIDPKSVSINSQCLSMIDFFEQWEKDKNAMRQVFSNDQLLELTYEEHIQNDPRVAYQSICRAAGLEPIEEEHADLTKTTPFPLRDVISNYAEISEYLKDTRWASMLDD